jgi:ubiquinone/menaquinone biosynthesis C-methylase UbiE
VSEAYRKYVLDWQKSRRLETSAAFFVPHLDRGMRLLDCGCGPGTITLDFAEALDEGEVIGIDDQANVLDHARKAANERGIQNARFEVGQIYDLQFEDASFDAVWTSSVIQWLNHPAKALAEILRVLKSGGVYASRDRDRRGDLFGNLNPLVEQAIELHYTRAALGGFHANCGGDLRAQLLDAGFERVLTSASYESRGDPEGAQWTAGFFLRVLREEYKLKGVRAAHLINEESIPPLIEAWERWAEDPLSWYAVCRVENVAWKA